MTGRKHFASLLVIIVSAALWNSILHAQAPARARIIHIAAGNPAIDVYINGGLAVADLSYGEDSAYFSLPAGAAELRAYSEGRTSQLIRQPLNLENDASAVILSSNSSRPVHIIPDDLSPLDFGMSRLVIVNALEDGSDIDIISPDHERVTGEDIAPGTSLGPFELPADQVDFSLLLSRANGDTAHHNFSAMMPAGTSSILLFHGDSENPQLLHATAAADADFQSGRVRFVHAAQGAAPIDLKINDHMIIPSLALGNPSEHIAIPGGSHQLTLSLGGTVISSMSLGVSAGQMQTAVLMGSPSSLKVHTYPDSLRDLNESSAVVNLVNAVPNSSVSRLRLESGAIVAADVEFGGEGGAAQIVPGVQSLLMVLEIGDERGTVNVPPIYFYAGSYYNLIAMPGSAFTAPHLLVAETSLMRRVTASPPAMDDPTQDVTELSAEESADETEHSDAMAKSEEAPEPDTGIEEGRRS